MRIVCCLVCLFTVGCASYSIPIQTDNHPASTDMTVYQIQLSPILDLNEAGESDVHPHE